jgi:hypothetical protein
MTEFMNSTWEEPRPLRIVMPAPEPTMVRGEFRSPPAGTKTKGPPDVLYMPADMKMLLSWKSKVACPSAVWNLQGVVGPQAGFVPLGVTK